MTMHTTLLSDIDDCARQPFENRGNCTDAAEMVILATVLLVIVERIVGSLTV